MHPTVSIDEGGLDTPQPPRLCLYCKHWTIYEGSPGYSADTPGWDMEIFCGKKHWRLQNDGTSGQSFREAMETAKTCPDFTPCP